MIAILLKVILILLGARTLYFIYEGFYWRRRFRQWKAQGVVSLQYPATNTLRSQDPI